MTGPALDRLLELAAADYSGLTEATARDVAPLFEAVAERIGRENVWIYGDIQDRDVARLETGRGLSALVGVEGGRFSVAGHPALEDDIDDIEEESPTLMGEESFLRWARLLS